MFGTQNLWLFVISGLLLNFTPGPDTLYILGRSSIQGVRGGSVAALGIGTGCLVHIFAATAGLSALIAASAAAFTVVKLIGAAYLVYMGVVMLRSRATVKQEVRALPVSSFKVIFWQGFLTNTLNPKIALFFLAFLPQFIAADAPNKSLALLFLGVLFNINGTLWNLFVAWASSSLIKQVRRSGRVTHWLQRTIGVLFLYFGARLAISQS